MRFLSSLFLVLTVFSANSFALDCPNPHNIEKAAEAAWNLRNPDAAVQVAGGESLQADAFHFDGINEAGYAEFTVHLQDETAGQDLHGYLVRTNPTDCTDVVGKAEELRDDPNGS